MECEFCKGNGSKVFGTIYCIHQGKNNSVLGNGVIIKTGNEVHHDAHVSRLGLKLCWGGRQDIILSGKKYSLFPNQVLLVNAGQEYETHFTSFKEKGGVISIGFTSSFIKEFLQENSEIFDSRMGNEFYNGVYSIASLPSDMVNFILTTKHITDSFYRMLLNHMMVIHKNERERTQLLEMKKTISKFDIAKRLMKARDYMHSTMSTNPSLTEISKSAGLSIDHFRKLFTQYYQKSPHQYLIDIKMARALDLVSKTDMMVNEIGALSGYDDPSSFTRAFKGRFGCSPEQLRL